MLINNLRKFVYLLFYVIIKKVENVFYDVVNRFLKLIRQ